MKKHLHVQFLYQDNEEQEPASDTPGTGCLEPERIDALPDDVRNTLLAATVNLDQEAFFAALERLPPVHKKTVAALRALAENYQFEEVENIIGRKK